MTTEAEVRAIVAAVNERIRAELRRPILSGPAIDIAPLNADAFVARWRRRRRIALAGR